MKPCRPDVVRRNGIAEMRWRICSNERFSNSTRWPARRPTRDASGRPPGTAIRAQLDGTASSTSTSSKLVGELEASPGQ